MSPGDEFESQLKKHLFGGEAFIPIDQLLEKITFEKLGVRPMGLPYSFYELFYHIRFTQRDILEYCKKKDYTAPSWPDDYWPDQTAPADPESWEKLKKSFIEDRTEFEKIISSNTGNLSDYVPSGKEHSIFREILLVIEHTAYHTGQLVIILRHLGLHSS